MGEATRIGFDSFCLFLLVALCSGNILIPPTDKARKIADYLRVAIGLHVFLAVFLMLGGRYPDGVFDLLGALIGFMAIKNAEGYSFQCGQSTSSDTYANSNSHACC